MMFVHDTTGGSTAEQADATTAACQASPGECDAPSQSADGVAVPPLGASTNLSHHGGNSRLPVREGARPKLASLGKKFGVRPQDVQDVVLKYGDRYTDNGNDGNINVLLQRANGGYVRVTLDPTSDNVISAGLMQGSQVRNGIKSGRFVLQQDGESLPTDVSDGDAALDRAAVDPEIDAGGAAGALGAIGFLPMIVQMVREGPQAVACGMPGLSSLPQCQPANQVT